MVQQRIVRLVSIAALVVAAVCGAMSVPAGAAGGSIAIVVEPDGTPSVPVWASPGLTLVTLDNRTNLSFGVALYLLPAAVVDRIARTTPAATEAGALPAWLDAATPVGGPGIAGPNGHTEALVDLLPGTYAVVFNAFSPETGMLQSDAPIHVDGSLFLVRVESWAAATPEPQETPEPVGATPAAGGATEVAASPEASPVGGGATPQAGGPPEVTATVVMTDDGIELPPVLPAGPQIWEVVNRGRVSHCLIVAKVPKGTTDEQLRAALFSAPGASPAPFDVSAMTNVGGLGPLAPGLSAAVVFNLDPGTYAVFSALPDPTTGRSDGAHGLLAVFVVA